ncbi:hypothetical protein [Pannonibacter sp. SL95]|uniref:hypothetical protein n=1 Tax=Pannonibacter sp. SL95 TaxID=2995153 RepID=UPI002275190D|nr:hypothetical protein [Pannonibacter sp. SL95]MCY1708403.1 hypothetical protein [Pannonibacter sp. SL95]
MGEPFREQPSHAPLWLTIEPRARRDIERAAAHLAAFLRVLDGEAETRTKTHNTDEEE